MPSIRKRRDKWQVQIRIKDAPPIAKSFTLKQDAERWAREMEAQAQRGDLPANQTALNGFTLGCLVKRYRREVLATTPIQSYLEALKQQPSLLRYLL